MAAPDVGETRQHEWHFDEPITTRNLVVKGCAIGLGSNSLMRTEAARAAGQFDERMKLYVDVDWLCWFLNENRMEAIDIVYTRYNKAPTRAGELVEAAGTVFYTRTLN